MTNCVPIADASLIERQRRLDAGLARHHLELDIVGSVALFLPAAATVAKTDLISTVPARLHQRSATKPALKWFRELMKSQIVEVASNPHAQR